MAFVIFCLSEWRMANGEWRMANGEWRIMLEVFLRTYIKHASSCHMQFKSNTYIHFFCYETVSGMLIELKVKSTYISILNIISVLFTGYIYTVQIYTPFCIHNSQAILVNINSRFLWRN